MQPYQKLLLLGVLLCVGLVNLLLPQYVMAVVNWWGVFREDNFDEVQVEEMIDDALGYRQRPTTEMGYRVTGGLLIAAAIVLWFIMP